MKGYNAFLNIEHEVEQIHATGFWSVALPKRGKLQKQAQIIRNKEKLKTVIFKHSNIQKLIEVIP